jgi:hypothetical protein
MSTMDPKLFRFQVNGDTEREVETFMTTASAIDVVIEEWDYTCKSTQKSTTIVHGFGMSPCLPQTLNRLADVAGVALIYTAAVSQEDYDFFLLEQALQAEKEKR